MVFHAPHLTPFNFAQPGGHLLGTANEAANTPSVDESLVRLVEGNRRFTSGTVVRPDQTVPDAPSADSRSGKQNGREDHFSD